MIRRWFSNFIRKNKGKLIDLGKKIMIVAMVVLIATIMLSFMETISSDEEKDSTEVYRPTETIVKGSDISEEQYTKDSNIVSKFLDFCNNSQLEEAYNLLSNDCKKELYPTIEYFKDYYHNVIFNETRECTMQSWISTKEYTVYKVRYPNNMMSTGTYNEDDVYEDYITLKKDATTESVSIGNFVSSEDCNIKERTDEIEVTVIKKKQYITYEEYEIKVKNKTANTMLLDDLTLEDDINLVLESGTEYGMDINKLFYKNLIIEPGITRTLTLRFEKNLGVNKKSESIKFSKIIKDYDTYIKDIENYNDITAIEVDLED